jgi:hypothetical protein
MAKASPKSCSAPAAPGPQHPQELLADVFGVTDGSHTAYLLGWQLVPYHGPGTYHFASGGDLLALEPSTGGNPVGFGAGSITVSSGGLSGSLDATVKLAAGGTLAVTGHWSCPS